MLKLDLVQTLAFAGLVLFAGYGVRRGVPLLARHNLPAPVVGGVLVAIAVALARSRGLTFLQFDTTLQTPLMIAFFTSIGFAASVSLLRAGGPLVALFLLLASAAAVLQNLLGMFVSVAMGQTALLGVLAGSVTLTGGPATGLAFAPLFEQAGIHGAATLAVAAAMVGIVSGGLLGGPLGTWLIERSQNQGRLLQPTEIAVPTAASLVEARLPDPALSAPAGEDVEAYGLLKHLVIMLVAMWIGAWIGHWFEAIGFTLPVYIGAMLMASVFRNIDDVTGWLGLSQRLIDDLGTVALALFLALALMTLRLWELASLAVPLTVVLAGQVVLTAGLCVWPVHRLMGRDYEGAVMASGFCGFMLGTTANAMANMAALVERYGPAPKAFLVVPMVGAFFLDFTNALVITIFLNLLT